MRNQNFASEVREAARGQWIDVLSALGGESLHGPLSKPGNHHFPCPVHGGKDGFRVYKDVAETGGGICNSCTNHKGTHGWSDGFGVLMWIHGWDFPTVLREVGDFLGLERDENLTPAEQRAKARQLLEVKRSREREQEKRRLAEAVKTEAKIERNVNAIETLWKEAQPLSRVLPEVLANYFKSRGVLMPASKISTPEVEAMRFHPALTYSEKTEDGTWVKKSFPGIVMPILSPQGELVTLHRTWLAKDGSGKAPISTARKQMEAVPGYSSAGGFIPIGGIPDTVLGVAEGLETALSALCATGIPTWSTVNAGNLALFTPPRHVKHLLVWADLDRSGSGQSAAETLKERMAHLNVQVHIFYPKGPIPDGKSGVDWNDVLLERGLEGFPSNVLIRAKTAA